jgi:hypothetical protein
MIQRAIKKAIKKAIGSTATIKRMSYIIPIRLKEPIRAGN